MSPKILKYFSVLLIFFSLESKCQFQSIENDWLIKPIKQKANITHQGNRIILDNGLLRREFYVGKNLACYGYLNVSSGQQLLRAIQPEAKLVLNGKMYAVGGMEGQKERAYLRPDWLKDLTAGPQDFTFIGFQISDIKPFISWKRKTWASNHEQATGKQISFEFTSPIAELKGIHVFVNYELVDGLPLLIKWVKIENKSTQKIELDRVIHEVLGLVEEESAVVGKPEEMKKQHGIYVETNYAFNNAMRYDISDQTTHWKTEPSYTSQVNYNFETPCLLEIYPEKAPGINLKPGEDFNSPRTHELLMDSYDRQRRGLMIRRMYQKIAPWTTQNPIFMHLISKNDAEVKTAIDQCVATGYEALILSFGSHLKMEDSTATNILRWKNLADYAHAKNVMIGGYSLFSSRKISDSDDVIDPKTGKPGGAFFGNAPCFGSPWGLAYRDKIKLFYSKTGFDIWENDGPYPGDVCASTLHPGHVGLKDSQWRQMEIQKELYRWLNEKGVYINAPDWYFLDGTHKIGIGYREVNFSLSRDQQKILNRQNIHDGTIEKTAAMSWGFVPLTAYQGGNAESVLEPLKDHLDDYHQLMMQYYGAGVQACYRGPRLFDTEETRLMVKETIDWYKKYRDVLNADMIQLRRPDGRDWDGFIHVNPHGIHKGFVMLYNPTNQIMERKISLPLYYTGILKTAKITSKEGTIRITSLRPSKDIDLEFVISPNSYTWFLID
jgi:hypothetical protein